MATFTFIHKAKEDMLAIGQPCTRIREGYSKYLAGKHVIFYRHITPVKSKSCAFCMAVWI
ncbi:MAG: type II toxin-antitoxin system RelE/ParE family toxin [Proteobacteria bacterium]|nr:type II toxin-antitoxin system RelE/ParE family toxin [Pseudomonadota bacterium]